VALRAHVTTFSWRRSWPINPNDPSPFEVEPHIVAANVG
jgi:hypothetical protein